MDGHDYRIHNGFGFCATPGPEKPIMVQLLLQLDSFHHFLLDPVRIPPLLIHVLH